MYWNNPSGWENESASSGVRLSSANKTKKKCDRIIAFVHTWHLPFYPVHILTLEPIFHKSHGLIGTSRIP
jgi:hypothetical protein